MRTDYQTGLREKVAEAHRTVFKGRPAFSSEVGVVLGSGLGAFADKLDETSAVFPYNEIPNMPVSSVEGHAGKLILGYVGDFSVVVLAGRVHLYEGWTPDDCTFGIRLMQMLGVKTVILTNAAGGINSAFAAGDLMVITDHLNLTGANPLTGPNDGELGPRFPDMSTVYDLELRKKLHIVAYRLGTYLREGVYAALAGPSYETPAEIRMLRTLGADAVGMSTVLEAIAARHGKMRVAGISCITNLAAGISPTPLSHDEVKATADRVKDDFIRLLTAAVPLLAVA